MVGYAQYDIMSIPPTARQRRAQIAAQDQEKALADTNETLRRAVGGSQPSWLTASAPVHPIRRGSTVAAGQSTQDAPLWDGSPMAPAPRPSPRTGVSLTDVNSANPRSNRRDLSADISLRQGEVNSPHSNLQTLLPKPGLQNNQTSQTVSFGTPPVPSLIRSPSVAPPQRPSSRNNAIAEQSALPSARALRAKDPSGPFLRDYNISPTLRNITKDELLALSCFGKNPPPATMPYDSTQLPQRFGQLKKFLHQVNVLQDSNMLRCVSGRLQALEQSIRRQDQMFIILHQLMCNFAMNGNFLPFTLDYPIAIQFVQNLLGNVSLPLSVFHAFRDFPFPLPALSETFQGFSAFWMTQVDNMFRHISARIESMTSECLRRRYPPTVKEMLVLLAVPSIQLMECIVILVSRKIWTSDPDLVPIQLKATQVHRENLARIASCRPNIQSMLDVDEQSFRHDYSKIDHEMSLALQQKHQQQGFQNWQDQQLQPIHHGVARHPQQAVSIPFSDHQIHPSHHVHIMPSQNLLYSPNLNQSQHVSQTPIFPSSVSRQNSLSRLTGRLHAPGPQRRESAQATPPLGHSILPPKLYYATQNERVLQPRIPVPEHSAIYQSHLAEPVLRIFDRNRQLTSEPYFQYIHDESKLIYELTPDTVKHNVLFTLTESEHASLPKVQSLDGSGLRARHLYPNSVQYRLRCFHRNRTKKTEFPQWLYLTLNGKALEVRKKLHHGTDLPIDITDMVQAGQNDLIALLNRKTGDLEIAQWVLEVQVIGLATGEEIISLVSSTTLSEQEVISSMIAFLTTDDGPAEDNDDDEIIMVSQSLKVKITDPITRSLISDMPVRAKDCKHFDCFALSTFLESRPRCKKKLSPSQLFEPVEATISEADKWACPMFGCDADARPSNLRLDLWMKKVQTQLEGRENGTGCVVAVEKDGSWRIEEPKKQQGQ